MDFFTAPPPIRQVGDTMETFITHDCAVVSVPVEFFKSRMNNGVVPRLLAAATWPQFRL